MSADERRLIRRARHRAEYAGVLAVRFLDRLLGRRLASALAAGLGRSAYRFLGVRRGVVEDQLRRAFPNRDDRWIRETAAASYAHLGREALSMLRLSRQGRRDVLAATDVDGMELLERAVGEGRGAVLVTGHFGNWEIGGAALVARGLPLDVVARSQSNPLVDRLINRARERLGMRVIDRWSATRESLRSLRGGRMVAFVADQDARHMGVFVPFMGRPASTYRGPAVLALRTGAPVFIVTVLRRSDGGYTLRISPVSRPDPGLDPDEQVRVLTAAHAAALESAVREHPEQYLWHHRRWKTDPPDPPAT